MYTRKHRNSGDELSFVHAVPEFPVDDVPPVAPVAPLRKTANRRARKLRHVQALLLSSTWLGVHVFAYGLRTDMAVLPGVYTLAQVVLPAGLAVVALAVALRQGRLGLGGSVSVLSALGIGGPVVFMLLVTAARALPQAGATGTFWSDAMECLDLMFALVLVPLLASTWAVSGAFPTKAMWRSALLGTACGLLSGATLNLHCEDVCPLHLLVGHGVPVALTTIVGALVVTRWTQI